MTDYPDEKAIRLEVARRVRGFLLYFAHLEIGLLLIASLPLAPSRWILGWVVLVWLVTFPAHSLWLLYHWLVDRGVQRELERQHRLFEVSEKSKSEFPNPGRLRLADDGELNDPALDGVAEAAPKRKRGHA